MADRQQKIKELTEHIYQGLDLDFVRQTGSLFATSTLRHASTRQQFAFMKDFRCQYDGRLLTERVTNLVCTQLLEEYKLEIPTTPGTISGLGLRTPPRRYWPYFRRLGGLTVPWTTWRHNQWPWRQMRTVCV